MSTADAENGKGYGSGGYKCNFNQQRDVRDDVGCQSINDSTKNDYYQTALRDNTGAR